MEERKRWFATLLVCVTIACTAALLVAGESCEFTEIRSVNVTPSIVRPGEEFTVSFEYKGTGPEYPYECLWISKSDGGDNIACHVRNGTPCQWYSDSFTLVAPSTSGTYRWYVAGYGASSNSTLWCGGGYDSTMTFTFCVGNPHSYVVRIQFTDFTLLTDQDDGLDGESELSAVLERTIGGTEEASLYYPGRDPGYITVNVEPGVPFSIPALTLTYTDVHASPLPDVELRLYVMEMDSDAVWQTVCDIAGGVVGGACGVIGGPIGISAGAVTGVAASKLIQELAGCGNDYLGHINLWVDGHALMTIANSGEAVTGELEDSIGSPDFRVSYRIEVDEVKD